jgi:hypothetical protein
MLVMNPGARSGLQFGKQLSAFGSSTESAIYSPVWVVIKFSATAAIEAYAVVPGSRLIRGKPAV